LECTVCSGNVETTPTLSLVQYLEEVQIQNNAYQAHIEDQKASSASIRLGRLLFAPHFFFEIAYRSEVKLQAVSESSYGKQVTDHYQIGLSQTTPLGLQAKLYYVLDRENDINMRVQNTQQTPPNTSPLYKARPVLELTQTLWQNSFGRGDRAEYQQRKAQAQADYYQA